MTRRAWVAVLIAVVLLVAAGATGIVLHRQRQQPPGLAAGLYRFPSTPASGGRNPIYPPNATVDGTPLLGLVNSITGGRADIEVKVGPLPAGNAGDTRTARHAELGVGQHLTVGGLVITVVHVWKMPNADHNAVDVKITHAAS